MNANLRRHELMQECAEKVLERAPLLIGDPTPCSEGAEKFYDSILLSLWWQSYWPRLQKLNIDVLLRSTRRQSIHFWLLSAQEK